MPSLTDPIDEFTDLLDLLVEEDLIEGYDQCSGTDCYAVELASGSYIQLIVK